MSATPHDDDHTAPAGSGDSGAQPEPAESVAPTEPVTRADAQPDDPTPVTPAPGAPYPPGVAAAVPPPPGGWRGRAYGVGGWRRRPLQLVLAGLAGLLVGCLLGGVAVAAVAAVVSRHDGYHHSRYEPDRRDWGPREDHRPTMPDNRPLPQPSQS